MGKMKPTEAMYNAGLKYLSNRGTAWCVNDLFEAMWEAAEIPNTAYPVHLDFMSDCCGFFMDLRYDGIFCNECGMSLTEAISIQHERTHALITCIMQRCNLKSHNKEDTKIVANYVKDFIGELKP